MVQFNERVKQVLLLILIILLSWLIIQHLYVFVPGFLGAITFYILCRVWYFRLVYLKKWRRTWTALLFMFGSGAALFFPVYVAIYMISPKIGLVINNSDKIVGSLKEFSTTIQKATGRNILDERTLGEVQSAVTGFLPSFLNNTLTTLANFAMMLFVLYFMLVNGRDMEKALSRFIPLKRQNINILAEETKRMIKANAFGIPIISIVQGITAAIGYWIFGLDEWGLWGFVTGVFAFFPIVGTMIVWVPLCIYLYTQGETGAAIGVGLYSLLVTGNVDYVARLTFMRKIGNVHPLITIFGVIVGLNLFGFVGLIFGPLLLSYLLVLIKIYTNEFSADPHAAGAVASPVNEDPPAGNALGK